MRNYELTVLIHPDLEADLDKPLDLIRKILKNNQGEITSEDNWGKKKLAYKIAKESFANYVYMEVKLPAAAVGKVSQTLNITDEVLRYLLVAVDEKARRALSEAKAKADAKEEEE